MPFSIPTYIAVNFVSKANLPQRINALKASYRIQYGGFTLFNIANIDPTALKIFTTNSKYLIKLSTII